jgi:dihydroflavonol-4-reductase
MDGSMPGSPRYSFGVVDVRDVADLHIRAMSDPAARGQRFLAVAGDFVSIHHIALTLRARLGTAARRVPTRVLPDWFIRLLALFVPPVRQITSELGVVKSASNQKARRLLGWSPRCSEDSVLATAESLVGLGLLRK